MTDLELMIQEAKDIETFCNSSYASDWELSTRSEKFKAKWNIGWIDVLNRLKV